MNLQDPAQQSLRPIGRRALTSVLLGEAFYVAPEAEELACLTPSPSHTGKQQYTLASISLQSTPARESTGRATKKPSVAYY